MNVQDLHLGPSLGASCVSRRIVFRHRVNGHPPVRRTPTSMKMTRRPLLLYLTLRKVILPRPMHVTIRVHTALREPLNPRRPCNAEAYPPSYLVSNPASCSWSTRFHLIASGRRDRASYAAAERRRSVMQHTRCGSEGSFGVSPYCWMGANRHWEHVFRNS